VLCCSITILSLLISFSSYFYLIIDTEASIFSSYLLLAEVFEEVLEIASYMTFYSPSISLDIWSLWPLMVEALVDWGIDFFPSMVSLTYL